ncbi:RHTO0S01e08878g1_1 [Rhodotorula toruloides]|uniref:RHTO0S01e08878g1_1 n=1 Tax=Rhodotorula toruloides TaxID=5286 RepID=A0A061AFE4_RHOTO|nr:RHTO0S01e08878g1_1 [Rhodotorula toruloides]
MHYEHPPPCPPSCGHCLAYDNIAKSPCTQPASSDSKWCAVHEELQAKLLKSYKRLTHAFEAFDDSQLPPTHAAISTSDDLPRLRLWSEAARSKWNLARRVIVARAEHHQQFYAGGDWGHALFVETLNKERSRMEELLCALDRRAYEVTLSRSSVSWILQQPTRPSFVCDEGPPQSASTKQTIETPPTPPSTPPSRRVNLPSAAKSPKTPSRASRRRKAANAPVVAASPTSDVDDFFAELSTPSPSQTDPHILLDRIREYLVPPTDLAATVRPGTWTSFVESVVRYVVLRVPRLANLVLAASDAPTSVLGLLHLLEARLANPESRAAGEAEVRSLWRGLKFAKSSAPTRVGTKTKSLEAADEGWLGVEVLADAIDAVFRSPRLTASAVEAGEPVETGEAVKLLGGLCWRESSRQDWPREGWDLFYQLIGCAGCALIATRSLAAWMTNRRLASLGHYPAWRDPTESPAERIFRLSGIALCSSNASSAGKRVKRIEQKGAKGGKGKKTVFVEEWEVGWMYIKLPLDDLRSALVLDHLASRPSQFAVVARRTAADEVTHDSSGEGNVCRSTQRCSCCRELPLVRIRSGLSLADRKTARWTVSTCFPRDTVLSSMLKSSSPESRFHPAPYADSYDAIIVDSSPATSPTHDAWSKFADSVAQAVLDAQGVESLAALTVREKDAAVERGEMPEGEWEQRQACAVQAKQDKRPRKVAYVCEENLTARRIFREE